MDPADRRAMGAMLESGAVNTGEADHWTRRLGRPCKLAEMAQEAMTHRTDSSQGRLDRIYGNFHTVDQLDKDLRVIALPWRLRLSSHRPVSFRRSTVEKKLILGVSAAALQHADFPRRVRLAFADSLKDHPDADAIIRLRLFKEAMVSVSRNLARKTQGVSAVTTLGEKLGVVMKYLRAIERGTVGEVDVCRRLYPPIDTYVANPYRLDGNITVRLAALRAHAVELARDFALQQLGEANELAATGQEDVAKRKRQRGARLLYKLAPGSCLKIGAIQAEDGRVVYDAGRMVKVLQQHWAKVFEARGVDTNILDTWVAEDKSARIAVDATQQLMRFVVFARSHAKQALDRSNDSAPGHDGVPL